jgi:hypothetical protein
MMNRTRKYADGGAVEAAPPVGMANLGVTQPAAPEIPQASPYASPMDYGMQGTAFGQPQGTTQQNNPALVGMNKTTGQMGATAGFAKGGLVKPMKPMRVMKRMRVMGEGKAKKMSKGGSVVSRGSGIVIRMKPCKMS